MRRNSNVRSVKLLLLSKPGDRPKKNVSVKPPKRKQDRRRKKSSSVKKNCVARLKRRNVKKRNKLLSVSARLN